MKENYDRHCIHQHQCMIDTKGKHSFIHSLTGKYSFDNKYGYLSFQSLLHFHLGSKTKTYQFYHYRGFDGFV